MSEMVEIYVDIHEKESRIFDAIIARNLGVVKGKHLETGDVLIRYKGYDVGIEIKRKQDFNNSLKKGRLHRQIYKLTKAFSFPILIVEGWTPWVGEGTNEDEIAKKMDIYKKTIRTLNRRICTYDTIDMNDTVDVISDIVRDLKKGKLNVLRRKIILIDEVDPQVNLMAGLDNIGIARAIELLEMFGTPENAFKNLEDWTLVDGINDRRLRKIKAIWEKEMVR